MAVLEVCSIDCASDLLRLPRDTQNNYSKKFFSLSHPPQKRKQQKPFILDAKRIIVSGCGTLSLIEIKEHMVSPWGNSEAQSLSFLDVLRDGNIFIIITLLTFHFYTGCFKCMNVHRILQRVSS